MKLYELTQDMKTLEKILEEHESENLLKELDKIKIGFEEKLKNIWMLIRKFESYETGIDEEIKRLQELKKYYKNQKEGLKNYVVYAMETAGKDKVETDLFKFSFRNSESVEIVDEEKIPEDYTEIVEVKKIDKMGIKKDLKAGKEIPWVQIVIKKNLQVK